MYARKLQGYIIFGMITLISSGKSGLKNTRIHNFSKYSHGQELFYKFVSKITNKLVKLLLSMTVGVVGYIGNFLKLYARL